MDPAMMDALRHGLILYIVLAASIALHEFGHAKMADMLGDFLPRSQGRVTLNPLVHLDPIGTGVIPLLTIFLPIFTHTGLPISLIGWGRPVQISLPHPKTRVRDEILITLAGPGMNFLIALVTAIAAGLVMRSHHQTEIPEWAAEIIYINAIQIAFNLIPLPPLDGSRILRHIVGMSEELFVRLATISPIILLVLINLPAFQHFINEATIRVAIPFIRLMAKIAGVDIDL
ncbi:MAG TPA: site-2 protease family protein [Opitutales bacterium]|jgi:Zn-dependent protease|nr:site-2 protease family protein [Opitutales bacterium]